LYQLDLVLKKKESERNFRMASIADVTLSRSLKGQYGAAKGRSTILWVLLGIALLVGLFVFLGRFVRRGGGGGDSGNQCTTDADCGGNELCVPGLNQCWPRKPCSQCDHNTELCYRGNCIPRRSYRGDLYACVNGVCSSNPSGDYGTLQDCKTYTQECAGQQTLPSGYYQFTQANNATTVITFNGPTYSQPILGDIVLSTGVAATTWYYDDENQLILLYLDSLVNPSKWWCWTRSPIETGGVIRLAPACGCNSAAEGYFNDGCAQDRCPSVCAASGTQKVCPNLNSLRSGFQLYKNGMIVWTNNKQQFIVTQTQVSVPGAPPLVILLLVTGSPTQTPVNQLNTWNFTKIGTANTETFATCPDGKTSSCNTRGQPTTKICYTNNRCIPIVACGPNLTCPPGYECRPTTWNNPPTDIELSQMLCVPIDAAPPMKWICQGTNAIGCVPSYSPDAIFNSFADCSGPVNISPKDPNRCLFSATGTFIIQLFDANAFLSFSNSMPGNPSTVMIYAFGKANTTFQFESGNTMKANNTALPATGYPRLKLETWGAYDIVIDSQQPEGKWYITGPMDLSFGNSTKRIYYKSNNPSIPEGWLIVGRNPPFAEISPSPPDNYDKWHFYLIPSAA
jgi:hypothetical protein